MNHSELYEETLRDSLDIPDEYTFVMTGPIPRKMFKDVIAHLNKCKHPVKFVHAKCEENEGEAEFFIHPLGAQYLSEWLSEYK